MDPYFDKKKKDEAGRHAQTQKHSQSREFVEKTDATAWEGKRAHRTEGGREGRQKESKRGGGYEASERS